MVERRCYAGKTTTGKTARGDWSLLYAIRSQQYTVCAYVPGHYSWRMKTALDTAIKSCPNKFWVSGYPTQKIYGWSKTFYKPLVQCSHLFHSDHSFSFFQTPGLLNYTATAQILPAVFILRVNRLGFLAPKQVFFPLIVQAQLQICQHFPREEIRLVSHCRYLSRWFCQSRLLLILVWHPARKLETQISDIATANTVD